MALLALGECQPLSYRVTGNSSVGILAVSGRVVTGLRLVPGAGMTTFVSPVETEGVGEGETFPNKRRINIMQDTRNNLARMESGFSG